MTEIDNLHKLAARFVDAKYAIDVERRRIGKQSVKPSAFVEYALPYADGGNSDASVDRVESIPSELVIGAHWNTAWDELPTGSRAHDLCDRLDALADTKSEPNWAIVVRVGALPLWYAIEGKNRVSLYRALRRPLSAEVRVSRHPPASELMVRTGEIMDGVARAAFPLATIPLAVDGTADLLLAAGACAGPRLSATEAQRLTEHAHKREAFLETRW